jgi:Predicted membrane protein (DUF2207)
MRRVYERLSTLFEFLIPMFFAIPIFAIFRMLWLYWTLGRDPEQNSVNVRYEPPENLMPAECGAWLENTFAVRSITATIVDLSASSACHEAWPMLISFGSLPPPRGRDIETYPWECF